MKINIKLIAALALGGFMASCAEQDIKEYYVETPESLGTYAYLADYGNIKDYIDRANHPGFKIGCALAATDYAERGIVFRVANSNFDEITLGNAMKHASVVGDDGEMNFDNINAFLDAVEGTGVTVYGHTLAWHAQQNRKYLLSLFDDVQIPTYYIEDKHVNYGELTEYPFTVINSDCTPVIEDGVLKASCSKTSHTFYLTEGIPTEVGKDYDILISARANKKVTVPLQIGADGNIVTKSMDVDTEFQNVKFTVTATASTMYIKVNPGRLKFDLEVEYVNVGHYSDSSRPLTEEEKLDNLHNAMTTWCNGMMEACKGRVNSWDLINEAISGGGNVNGYYDLQHDNGSTTDFFWQDYLGSEEYGPVVSKAACDAYVAAGGNLDDLKLFINDYNLESDWDDNQKLKSLIYWVGVWEKGGAKIDGLSSQMHISYYEDKRTMKSKADHYVKMLKLMAATGKLVRISELDMGYVDINGNDVKTADMTKEQQQNMANYYQFIIQMFLKIVPQAQQYGICQWCLTDSPTGSGWRADTPVGLWDLDWNRKPAYAGYCEAFKAAEPATEDFFEYLDANGLTHYISTAE